MTRNQLRAEATEYINKIPNDELFYRFGITRVAEITGYDFIGIPVHSAVRPSALRLSVSSGKGQTNAASRGGAIAESIEFHVMENPHGRWYEGKFDPGPLDMPTGLNSTWTKDTIIAMDDVVHFNSGNRYMYPSQLVWTLPRRDEDDQRWFMNSSNGNAVGWTIEDALVQGITELIERDQFTLRILSAEHGILPPMVDETKLYGRLATIRDACNKTGASIYLFCCTYDIQVPVYWSILIDRDGGMGRFAGYGCHINPVVAAERAMLEAIQSRAVYLSGARDDIMRRDFYHNKAANTKRETDELESLPRSAPVPLFLYDDMDVQDELGVIVRELGHFGDRLFYKHIDLGDFHVVKAILPGLEQIRNHPWFRPMRWHKLIEAEKCLSKQDRLATS